MCAIVMHTIVLVQVARGSACLPEDPRCTIADIVAGVRKRVIQGGSRQVVGKVRGQEWWEQQYTPRSYYFTGFDLTLF